MSVHRVLHALVRRAATYERPFNSQDSFLILKALHSLRFRSNDVKNVCEKCAFSIASARITVPVERAIDALSSLLSLQAAPLPIVHDKLAERLMEVTPQTASPRSVQKAAVAVMKLGRRYCRRTTADHIFNVLTQLVTLYPKDIALRLAVISVYAYTSNNTAIGNGIKPCGECGKYSERLRVLLEAAEYVVDAHVLNTLKGNSALQALHMFPILSRRSLTCHFLCDREKEEKSNSCSGEETTMTMWDRVGKAFLEELQFDTIVPGGYAQFLYDFLPSIHTNDPCGFTIRVALLEVIHHENFRKALNSYDVAKIAMALSQALQTNAVYRGQRKTENNMLKRVRRVQNDINNNINNKSNGVGDCGDDNDGELEDYTELRVLESLVEQLYFFHTIAGWSQSNTGRVDQVAVGAVWGVTQKYVCVLQAETARVKNIVSRLVQLTEGIATKLPDVWSWVLYSMSMCARTMMHIERLDDCVEALVQGSFLDCRPHKLSLRSCVQALYAVSILMNLGLEGEEQELPVHVSTAAKVERDVDTSGRRWGLEHPLIVDILKRLEEFLFGEHVEDDVPMLLKGLSNLMKGAVLQHSQPPASVHEMTKRVLYYIQGNRNAEWYHRHGVNMACTLLSMGQFLPDNSEHVKGILRHILSHFVSDEMIKLGALCRLMEHMMMLKREGVVYMWTHEHILELLAEHMPRVCREGKVPISVLLNTAEFAHEHGVIIVFADQCAEMNRTRRLTILLDLSHFLRDGAITPMDAAQLLRFMSYELQSTGTLYASADLIVRLRHIAIHREPVDTMQIQTLLYLLRANANLQASRALFDEVSLNAIVAVVYHQLTKRNGLLMRRGDIGKIVHAFLSSQVLLRLRRPLQSYDRLAVVVGEVLDAMESARAERPETLFQLRLLCGG